MTSTAVSVSVGVDPATAFTAFTQELDLWWVRGPINYFDSARAVGMRCEPGVGGRLLKVYDEGTGEGRELGRFTVWEPVGWRGRARSTMSRSRCGSCRPPDPLPSGPDPLAEGGYGHPWIEFRVGNCSLMVFKLEGDVPEQAPPTHDIWVFVDDLDAHHARAQAGGATIVRGIRQTGFRAYTAEDLEGHRWTFAQARPTQL